jgi:shikimate kinase/3-dehydroquinate synthase
VEALTSQAHGGAEARSGAAIVFVGFMGAGKSGAAKAVAASLRTQPLDSDRELERQLGEPLEAFFDREGEPAFRAREEQVVLRLLQQPGARVVALGGGAVGSERVREALRAHTVVHLEVDPDVAWERAAGKGRPLARDRSAFDRLHADRQALYESVAHATLSRGGRDACVKVLPALLALVEAPGARLVWARARSGDYPVFVGRGLLGSGFVYPREGRRFVVTDENVERHHRVEGQAQLAIPAGERQKTLQQAEEVLRWLAASGAERGDLVAAVGGGVVGDLAGFCAAVYQRGVRHVQLPTTLVAQVDSAYGGKTGVDLPEAKNYVGAYHQPAAVVCDPDALATLPPEELSAGYVEVMKTALIAGGQLWERVRGGAEPDEDLILACIRTKLAVVAEDERDTGRRQVLNLGHTVGHAVEAATGYAGYRHGEAVGIGLLCALRLSAREDLRGEVAALLSARGLPTRFSGASPDEVLTALERDKKRSAGEVPLVLVDGPGRVTHGHRVRPDELRSAVEEVHEG